MLTTLDGDGIYRRHECEVTTDAVGQITDICVPFVIKAHILVNAWLQTAIKDLPVTFKNPNLRFGNKVLLNKKYIQEFYKAYGPE